MILALAGLVSVVGNNPASRSIPGSKIRRPVRRQIPVFVLVHSQMFCSRFELLQHLNSHFVSLLKPKKAHIFVGTLICNTSNCLVFGILISTPFQCLLTYISKHLSRSPPFPPRRGTHPAVACCCSVDPKWRVPQRCLVGASAGGNVRQNVKNFPQISPSKKTPRFRPYR